MFDLIGNVTNIGNTSAKSKQNQFDNHIDSKKLNKSYGI